MMPAFVVPDVPAPHGGDVGRIGRHLIADSLGGQPVVGGVDYQ